MSYDSPTVDLQPGEFIQDGYICKPLDANSEAGLSTCQPDPRFPQVNISSWCFTMFVDYKRCGHLLGDDNKECCVLKKCFQSVCPNAWVERWEDQIEGGRFPRDLTRPQ